MFALFSPAAGGTLSVFGDNLDNAITLSRDATGKILVNRGAVTIFGGTPTVANTASISVFGQAGNDAVTLDETNGVLPNADLFGGAGDDTLTGGSGADRLFGQAGNDTLLGKGGNDLLLGGAGDDALTGGAGDDQVFGEAGNDRMVWNPGDGTDLNEGGAGTDTAEVNGGNGAETFTTTANGTRVRFDRITPGPFSLDVGTTETLSVNLNGGDDTFTAGNGLAGLIQIIVDGGAGNDTITGGDGADRLSGGDGNDLLAGGRGNDALFGGAGDDTFVWNPGDGTDTLEGQAGHDAMLFNGANVAENIDISANGTRVRFTRDVANIAMELNGVEQVDFNALGGADKIHVHDLSGTDLSQVNLDLSLPVGSGTGDGVADQVVVDGTNGNDNVPVTAAAGTFTVTGLPAVVTARGVESSDQLVVNGLGGDDAIDAHAVAAGLVIFGADGGAGNDTITGSDGPDLLKGGDGNDRITGGRGDDRAELGAGDDTFVWNPGDGSDIVEGQDGSDRLLFNGANAAEAIDISANGSRVQFSRDVGNVTTDLNGVEQIDFNALDGADTVTVNDLSATGVKTVNLNLNNSAGIGDGQTDSVVINGTDGDDAFQIAAFDNGSRIGLGGGGFPVVNITGAEGANDKLTVNALAGNDVVDASSLPAGLIGLTLNGGAGNDTLKGSAGNDLFNGGTGTDVALLGAGDDTFVWNPGDGSDTVEGQDGTDTLLFNGANVNERIDVSANGPRVRLTRDVGNVTMDLNGLEVLTVNASGGADTVTVNDLAGTGVTTVNVNLFAAGVPDGQPDSVVVNGTAGDDAVVVAGDATGVSVIGLAATIIVTGAEAANDRLTVNGLAGDDAVNGSGLAAGTMLFTADGGDGNDVLIGSPGHDVLLGGPGDDTLIGNGGGDVLDGGPGNNVIIP
jgi:Ca2+-binding RTX toxin-like protein